MSIQALAFLDVQHPKKEHEYELIGRTIHSCEYCNGVKHLMIVSNDPIIIERNCDCVRH